MLLTISVEDAADRQFAFAWYSHVAWEQMIHSPTIARN